MARINEHYLKLAGGYLFPEIGRRVRAFSGREPRRARLIRLGIGDVMLPLGAVDRRGDARARSTRWARETTSSGYGPEQGYDFLRDAIVEHDYKARGVEIDADEIFVSDGSKCDSGNIQEIFATAARVAVTDPVYPVYVDTNVMAGRTGAAGEDGRYAGIVYLPCTEKNGFRPAPPDRSRRRRLPVLPEQPDRRRRDARAPRALGALGAARRDAVILFDAAYEALHPRPGAAALDLRDRRRARGARIEFRSFSKRAGFTGAALRATWWCRRSVAGTGRERATRVALHRAVGAPPHARSSTARPTRPARRRGVLHAGRPAQSATRASRSTWRTRA